MAIDIKLKLDLHAKWLKGENGGQRADLSGANLNGADLSDADLSDADLSDADLSDADLRGANLRRANLNGADLSGANLSGADLSGANLSGANLNGADLSDADLSDADLRRADLSGADLRRTNLDFSSGIPFHCGGFNVKADMRLVAQMAKHLAMLDVSLCCKGVQEAMEHFRQTGLAHLFDEFREDLQKTPCGE